MGKDRVTPIEISKNEFKKIGYQLIDTLSDFIDNINDKPVTTGESPAEIQNILGHSPLPELGVAASELLTRASDLLLNHSLLNGHPKFFGYITSSPAPIGALADLLAATVNPNVGANVLSPMATAIENQTIKWLAEFIGVSQNYGGILVSGGNMANFTGFLAGRTSKAPKSFKNDGLLSTQEEMVLYCSKTTHTWIEKAAILFGHGIKSIRWVATNADNKMNNDILSQLIEEDFKKGKSHCFRALKVWMTLQQVGKKGYIKMINEDIALSKMLFEEAQNNPELEAVTQSLSINTLRYLPSEINQDNTTETYLNNLNEKLLNELQRGGEVSLSNAVILEKYCLRACIVNFRTSEKGIKGNRRNNCTGRTKDS